jgi:magnesium-transporting ATPase (P-type)
LTENSTDDEVLYQEKRGPDYLNINDPDALSNLGHVEYALFDKTGTVTSDVFNVDSICIGDKIFDINSKSLEKLKKKLEEKKNLLYHHTNLHEYSLFKNTMTLRQKYMMRDPEEESINQPPADMSSFFFKPKENEVAESFISATARMNDNQAISIDDRNSVRIINNFFK